MGSRALFPQGPSFKEQDFSTKDFITRDFIDELADAAMPPNRRSGPITQPAFDPKPLIRTFESMGSIRPLAELSSVTMADSNCILQMRYHSWLVSQRSWKRRSQACKLK